MRFDGDFSKKEQSCNNREDRSEAPVPSDSATRVTPQARHDDDDDDDKDDKDDDGDDGDGGEGDGGGRGRVAHRMAAMTSIRIIR